MAQANFDLQKFLALAQTQSFARTNRFEVLIPPPIGLLDVYQSDNISIMVEQASFPLLNITTKGFKIFGPTYQRPVTTEYGGEGMSISFHIDRDMRLKKFFEDWMHLIVNPIDFTVSYQEEYITSIYIRQLDEQDFVTHEVVLYEAFPRNMNILELNNAATNQTHRLNMLFAYRYWQETVEKQPTDLPRKITTPQLPSLDVRPPPEYRQWNWQTGEINNRPGSDLPPAA